MRRKLGTILVVLLLLQVLFVMLQVPVAVEADVGEIVIASDENVVWADGTQNLTGKVTVQGTLTVRNYELRFNLSQNGGASFWVNEGGELIFENVSLLHDNLSAFFFIKVEGRFYAEDSELEHLTGQFVSGGGIKVVNGEVELRNTIIHDCEVQGVYLEGNRASAVLDNCTLYDVQYGVHVKDGAKATVQNGSVIELFSRAAVIVNLAEADVSNTTIQGRPTQQTQGIAARGSQIIVADTEIFEVRNDGIELADDASAGIYNVEIHGATVGIRLTSSSADILSANIYDCVDGLNIYLSDPIIRQSHLTGNVNGISSKDCEPPYLLDGCTIGGNSQLGAYVVGKGFREEDTQWTDDQGEPNAKANILQIWILDVKVTDHADNPIVAAKVVIRSSNGTKVFDGTTNALGNVTDIELQGHRILTDGTNVTEGKYKVHIEQGLMEADKAITMDVSKTLKVNLGKVEEVSGLSLRWVIIALILIVVLGALAYWWFRIR
jgi:hypothetical protein